MLEHQARDRGVEARIGERQVLGGGAEVARARRRARAATRSWARVGSTPTTSSAPSRVASRATCPSPVPTSTTRRRAGEALGREREDLLLVLGVGAVGEAVLPPLRVALPRVGFGVSRDARTRRRVTNGIARARRSRPARARSSTTRTPPRARADRPISNEKRSAFGPQAHRHEPIDSREPSEAASASQTHTRDRRRTTIVIAVSASIVRRTRAACVHERGVHRPRTASRLPPLRWIVCARNGNSPNRQRTHTHQAAYGTSATAEPAQVVPLASMRGSPRPRDQREHGDLFHERRVREHEQCAAYAKPPAIEHVREQHQRDRGADRQPDRDTA